MIGDSNTVLVNSLWETIVEQNSYISIPRSGDWNVLNAYNLFSKYNHIKLCIQIKYPSVESYFSNFYIYLNYQGYSGDGFDIIYGRVNSGNNYKNITFNLIADIIKISPNIWQVVYSNNGVFDTGGSIYSSFDTLSPSTIMFGTSYKLDQNLKFKIDTYLGDSATYRYYCYASKYI